MTNIKTILCAVVILITAQVSAQATNTPVKYFGKFHELSLNQIEPKGWLRKWLVNQQQGQTSNMQPAGHPFNVKVWCEDHPRNCDVPERGVWACHEQTGYWIDGQMRCGHLLRDYGPDGLVAKARIQTEGAIKIAHKDGFIGPLKDDGSQHFYMQWPHVVFFRAFMADYSATGNPDILKALTAHYDREIENGDIIATENRHLCNVEQLCWLYEQTGQVRFLNEAKRVMDESKQLIRYERPEYDAYNSHGVTYMEKVKTPVVMYLYTGDDRYLKIGLQAIGNMDRYHMLPDGVPSSCAGLFYDKPDLSHETCGISDYSWTCGYALMATGDTVWADRIERAVFNAGPGAVTKDFKAHQYYSAPNQAICDRNNCGARSAYKPVHGPECCSGNIHRFMPNYIARMWMSDHAGGLAAVMYGPSSVTVNPGGQEVTVIENTDYPFSDRIEFQIKTDKPAAFPLYLRIPGWCETPSLTVNGTPVKEMELKSGSFVRLERKFSNDDRIVLTLPAEPKARRWKDNGIIIERGSLLFAYDIPTKVTIDKKEKSGEDPNFPAYLMEPVKDAPWRYALDLNPDNSAEQIVFKRGAMTEDPFKIGANVMWVEVPAKLIPDNQWVLKTVIGKDRTSVMTPWPTNWVCSPTQETIKLIPYGSTCLRISIFPDARAKRAL